MILVITIANDLDWGANDILTVLGSADLLLQIVLIIAEILMQIALMLQQQILSNSGTISAILL